VRVLNTNELIELYSKSGLINNVQKHRSPPSNYTETSGVLLEGSITVFGKKYSISILVSDNFPIEKPKYQIDPLSISFIPHIGVEGDVCYTKDEGVFWDYTNPDGIIFESLLGVINTLKDGFSKENKLDLISEFESYWLTNKSAKKAYRAFLHVELKDKVCTINSYEFGEFILIGEQKQNLIDYYGFSLIHSKKLTKSSKVLFIPLMDNTRLYPPKYTEFWDSSKVYQIIEKHVSSQNKLIIENILSHSKKRNIDIIIFRLQQPNGSFAVFGVKYVNIANRKFSPILHVKNKSKLIPIIVDRKSKDYIAERGGANMNLSNKKVAIIGCGSVGGYIASELLKSGIGNLTLVDDDRFKSENIYRHYLGKEYVGKYKTDALKIELEKHIPYVKIYSHPKKVEDVLKTQSSFFNTFDLVIIATGNPTINLFLNEYFLSSHKGLPVIYTWLDPYGIGGHALLTNNALSGCYSCLYEDMHNKASFAQKGQSFSKSISGCGSLYTPYGSIDSVETAIKVVRLSLSVLLGKEKANPIISWKGNPDTFLNEEFKLSDRFGQTIEDIYTNRNSYINENCKICSKNH